MSRGDFWRCDHCGNTEHNRMPGARVELNVVAGDMGHYGPLEAKAQHANRDFCNWRCATLWCVNRRGPWSLRVKDVEAALDGTREAA